MYWIAFNLRDAQDAVGRILTQLYQSKFFISTPGVVYSEDPGIVFAVASVLDAQGSPYAMTPLPSGPWRRGLMSRLASSYSDVYSCWMCGRVSETKHFCNHCTSVSLVPNPIRKRTVPAGDLWAVWYLTRFYDGSFYPGMQVTITPGKLEPISDCEVITDDIYTVAEVITKAELDFNLALAVLDGYFAFKSNWKTPRAEHNLMLLHERYPRYRVPAELSLLRAPANYPTLLERITEYQWERMLDSHAEQLKR
jgi:hypothetical protein